MLQGNSQGISHHYVTDIRVWLHAMVASWLHHGCIIICASASALSIFGSQKIMSTDDIFRVETLFDTLQSIFNAIISESSQKEDEHKCRRETFLCEVSPSTHIETGNDPMIHIKRGEVYHPSHRHILVKVDILYIYTQFFGGWYCDCCKKGFDGRITEHRYPYHCEQCEYDICNQCAEGYKHPLHLHVLYPRHGNCTKCMKCQTVATLDKTTYHCKR